MPHLTVTPQTPRELVVTMMKNMLASRVKALQKTLGPRGHIVDSSWSAGTCTLECEAETAAEIARWPGIKSVVEDVERTVTCEGGGRDGQEG